MMRQSSNPSELEIRLGDIESRSRSSINYAQTYINDTVSLVPFVTVLKLNGSV